MREIKITAIAASAILWIFAAAFSTMAANRWELINDVWCGVDNDGNPVEFTWVIGQDGNKYWAGEDGIWMTNAWVGEDEDIYVGIDGKVATGWQQIANNEDEVEDYGYASWYYLTAKGKKTFCTTKAKLIDGARYCFDSTGRMLSGWVGLDGEGTGFVTLDPDEDGISAAEYYCNGPNEGWAASGWVNLYAPDGENADTDYFWFFFNKTSGAITKNGENYKKKIDGYTYTFDEDGRMLIGFVPSNGSSASASYALESGRGAAKEWLYAVPTNRMIAEENAAAGSAVMDDSTYHWFWFDKHGSMVTSAFTTGHTSNKYWALDPAGIMLSGLYEAETINNHASKITEAVQDIPYYVEAIDSVDKITNSGSLYMYFGEEGADGSLKTGVQEVVINGEKITMRFSKSIKDDYYVYSSNHARAIHITPGLSVYGFNGGKYYLNGQIVCGNEESGLTIAELYTRHTSTESENAVCAIPKTKTSGRNSVLDDVTFAEAKQNATRVGTTDYYEIDAGTDYCIVKPDGTIVKKASGIKDADGNRYYVSDYRLTKIKEAE